MADKKFYTLAHELLALQIKAEDILVSNFEIKKASKEKALQSLKTFLYDGCRVSENDVKLNISESEIEFIEVAKKSWPITIVLKNLVSVDSNSKFEISVSNFSDTYYSSNFGLLAMFNRILQFIIENMNEISAMVSDFALFNATEEGANYDLFEELDEKKKEFKDYYKNLISSPRKVSAGEIYITTGDVPYFRRVGGNRKQPSGEIMQIAKNNRVKMDVILRESRSNFKLVLAQVYDRVRDAKVASYQKNASAYVYFATWGLTTAEQSKLSTPNGETYGDSIVLKQGKAINANSTLYELRLAGKVQSTYEYWGETFEKKFTHEDFFGKFKPASPEEYAIYNILTEVYTPCRSVRERDSLIFRESLLEALKELSE